MANTITSLFAANCYFVWWTGRVSRPFNMTVHAHIFFQRMSNRHRQIRFFLPHASQQCFIFLKVANLADRSCHRAKLQGAHVLLNVSCDRVSGQEIGCTHRLQCREKCRTDVDRGLLFFFKNKKVPPAHAATCFDTYSRFQQKKLSKAHIQIQIRYLRIGNLILKFVGGII